ncbi:hypothetical protein CEXT_153142 [Caerostris extrusa]|uniref:Uncharacterized protein n=2 Tax=Caerostris extrusa TaxID=172846 RepID=A0AAV4NUH8_CAEEX|nr:hypothetical protein CEXT_153142 [Caerostris extrusa]
MLKVMKRLVVSGFKPHTCRVCNDCYVCHACMWERNLIRQCCFGVTEEQLDALHEELKNKFPVLQPLMEQDGKLTSTSTESASHSKYTQMDFQNCPAKSDKRNSLECSICGKAFKTDFTFNQTF